MSSLPRCLSLMVALLLAGAAHAATPQAIEDAIRKGTTFLKRQAGNAHGTGEAQSHRFGVQALAGLALLEAGVPADDPAIVALARHVRHDSFTQTQTYSLALGVLFLDRLNQTGDGPLVQMLGIRLLAGQTPRGGWTYQCIPDVPDAELTRLRQALAVRELRAEKAPKPRPGAKGSLASLHPVVLRHARLLSANLNDSDDNSNTQFAIMGLWTARRHGVDVERGLALVEARFLQSQAADGGWGYQMGGEAGTPSMTCAGLLGLATGLARRDERQMKAERKRSAPKAKPVTPDTPFFRPPAAAGPAGRADPREQAVRRGIIALSRFLDGLHDIRNASSSRHGTNDLYFLWSVERVGVLYELDRIGGVNWYDVGAESLVRLQNADGSWSDRNGTAVGTPLALLFLCKANLTRDLKAVRNNDQFSELRSEEANAPAPPAQTVPPSVVAASPPPVSPAPATPPMPKPAIAAADDAPALAAALVRATEAGTPTLLAKLRDSRGAEHTHALLLAIPQLAEGRQAQARDALADRLTRMTPATLRQMMRHENAELRRGAALAAAMKGDTDHIPDLIERLDDASALVWLAAKAGLKSLTGQDHGPAATATAGERQDALRAWKAWYAASGK